MVMSQWWSFTKANVATDNDNGAVYEFGDSIKNVVYIGSSGQLKTRLQQHLNGDDTCINTNAKHYRFAYTASYKTEEKGRFAAFVKANSRMPLCNDVTP